MSASRRFFVAMTAALVVVIMSGCPASSSNEPALLPDSGSIVGGTIVTILAEDVDSATRVLFDGVEGLDLQSLKQSELQVTTPAHASGSVDVAIFRGDELLLSLPAGFEYRSTSQSTAFVVQSLDPVASPASGAVVVRIHGNNLQPGSTVIFGGIRAANTEFESAGTLLTIAPSHPAGVVDVVVVGPDNETASTLRASFTYID